GMQSLRSELAGVTSSDVWLLSDAPDNTEAAAPRPRTKLSESRRMRSIAASATDIPRPQHAEAEQVCNTEHLPAMSIAYATEPGNAELVAEELVKVVASHANATVIDLAAVEPDEIPVDTPMLVITSSYDERDLATGIR